MAFFYKTSTVTGGNMDFRFGSVSDVVRNRTDFLNRHGSSLEQCVALRVEHGDAVIRVGAVDCGKGMHEESSALVCDALMTNEKNVGLFLLTADCIPCVFHDEAQNALALVHLGWKCTALHLAVKVLESMKAEYGTHPKDIRVVCGPSISTESYIKESPEQLKDPAWQPYIRVAASGGTHIDIFGYNKALLIAAGVPEDSITAPLADTVTDTRYFSYYRAVKTGEPQGRIATVAYLQ